MKHLITVLSLMCISAGNAFAKDIFVDCGTYRAAYKDGVGRATITMTGSPGIILLSTDRNKCTDGLCQMLGIPGDFSSMPFRLEKISEVANIVTYQAVALELTDLGKAIFIPEFQESLKEIKITISADVSGVDSMGGSRLYEMPRKINMKIERDGLAREYLLIYSR